jgi:hypothetical protein
LKLDRDPLQQEIDSCLAQYSGLARGPWQDCDVEPVNGRYSYSVRQLQMPSGNAFLRLDADRVALVFANGADFTIPRPKSDEFLRIFKEFLACRVHMVHQFNQLARRWEWVLKPMHET